MPRGKRLADPLVGENTLGSDSDSSQSNTSSPLVPLQLTVEVSPPHTEESNEVAQINSDGQSFQVDFITDTQHRLPATASPSPYVLSPSPSLCGSRKIDVFDDHKTERGHVPRDFADPHSRKAERLVNSSSDKRFQFEASSPVKRLRTSCEEHSSQTNHHISTEAAGDQNESRENMAAISPTVTSGSDQCRRGAREDLHEQTSNDSDMNCCQDNTALCQVDNVELVDNQPASPTLSGFMTVTSRNGESVMHGLLPSLISHPHNTASLSGCVPAEGNWYQIVPTGLPAVTRDQTQTPVNTNTSSLFSLGSVSSVMTTTSTPAVSVAATASGDPLLGFLQQFAGSTPDVLRLPVNMSAAAPRFLYAPHARSGQLLLVSPVGDISSIQQSGHQTTHQLPQQQPLIQQQQQQHLQYLQLQPQPLMHQQQPPPPQPTTAQQNQCKSPLKTNQQQNTVTAFNPVLPGKLRKGGFVNQQTKFATSLGRGSNQENMPPVVAAQELLALSSPARTKKSSQGTIPPPLYQSSPRGSDDEPVRENHNMKERRRRARIKEACDLMRELVPGMSDKTDKATVFEFSARYIHFLKNFVGAHHDKDFLIKYSPY